MRRLYLGAGLVVFAVVGCAGGDASGIAPSQDLTSTSGERAGGNAEDAAAPDAPLVVRSMANLGDSISQGYDADDSAPVDLDKALTDYDAVFHDNPQYSWVQGTDPRIASVASSMRAIDDKLTLTPISRSGAELVGKVGDHPNFEEQTALLVAKDVHPDLTWVLLGGNDVCNRPKSGTADATATLYPIAEWTAAVDKGLANLAAGLDPGATVRILSMPRVDRLYDQAGDAKVQMKYGLVTAAVTCKQFWSVASRTSAGVCPILTTEPDAARRAAIGARIDAYNDALAAEARRFTKDSALNPRKIRFVSDWHGGIGNGGVENASMGTYAFDAQLVSKRDCFHPSVAGQAAIANMALHIATWE